MSYCGKAEALDDYRAGRVCRRDRLGYRFCKQFGIIFLAFQLNIYKAGKAAISASTSLSKGSF